MKALPHPRRDERDRRTAGQDLVLGARGRGHRRRPLHPVRHLRRRLPVQLDRHRRGHRPARAGQDVHRLLAVLGLLPPRRAALRGPVAAVDGHGRRTATRRTRPRRSAGRRWSGPTRPTTTGRSPEALPAMASVPCSSAYAVRAGARPTSAQDGGVVTALLIAALAGGRDRRRPGDPAERRSRRAVEGRGPPGHHGQGDHRRRRQLLQPDDGAGRAGSVRATTCLPSHASPWSGRRARSRASGPCSRDGGPPVPTGSTPWCSPSPSCAPRASTTRA